MDLKHAQLLFVHSLSFSQKKRNVFFIFRSYFCVLRTRLVLWKVFKHEIIFNVTKDSKYIEHRKKKFEYRYFRIVKDQTKNFSHSSSVATVQTVHLIQFPFEIAQVYRFRCSECSLLRLFGISVGLSVFAQTEREIW